MARVDFDKSAFEQFLDQNPGIRNELMNVAQQVKDHAERTAQEAQHGPGGTISGYAEAGFEIEWDGSRSRRPRVNIRSKASPEIITAVHFYTIKKYGVSHLRNALYKFTTRGGR
jgi:hypothetical protein